MVSIKTIAEECGVSIATVSKSLNGHKDISETTRNFVCETAKRLGYMPNSQARALKTNKSYIIGVLLADKAENGLTHVYFSAVIDSFKREMEKSGYDIVFISEKIGDRTMSFYEHCLYRNVDGVLAACVDFESNGVQGLIKSSVPLVAIDYKQKGLCSVVSDNRNGMSDLVNYIYSLGHRRIAYIYGDDSQVTSSRVTAYIDTLKMLGINHDENYLKHGKYLDCTSAEILTHDLMKLPSPPTCIIYPDDYCAISGLEVIKKYAEANPFGKISVAGYDGLLAGRIKSLSLTTVKQDTYSIGTNAGRLLKRIIAKEDIPEDEMVSVVRGFLVNGQTVGTMP
ncbi:MAG: LacI family DNA-binding transcriptional regulator [Ruminococcus sp.]|nr:LacI family DNA-binding transcriptional regulator [Ruminococcus sp.]